MWKLSFFSEILWSVVKVHLFTEVKARFVKYLLNSCHHNTHEVGGWNPVNNEQINPNEFLCYLNLFYSVACFVWVLSESVATCKNESDRPRWIGSCPICMHILILIHTNHSGLWVICITCTLNYPDSIWLEFQWSSCGKAQRDSHRKLFKSLLPSKVWVFLRTNTST